MIRKFPASLSGFHVCFYMSVSLMHGWIFFFFNETRDGEKKYIYQAVVAIWASHMAQW